MLKKFLQSVVTNLAAAAYAEIEGVPGGAWEKETVAQADSAELGAPVAG